MAEEAGCSRELEAATPAARHAGDVLRAELRAELHREGGHCPADGEAAAPARVLRDPQDAGVVILSNGAGVT